MGAALQKMLQIEKKKHDQILKDAANTQNPTLRLVKMFS